MGLLNFISRGIADKIGVVVGGDFKGAYVGYGTKEKKFTISVRPAGRPDVSNDAIIIFTKPEIRIGREDVESYNVQSSTFSTTTYAITLKNGRKCLIEINNQYKHKIDSALF